MKYYAFEYWSGRNTTTGQPNPRTGWHSIAGELVVFRSRKGRDKWVAAGKVTSDIQGNCREAVTARQARWLHRGMSLDAYNEMLECLEVYP